MKFEKKPDIVEAIRWTGTPAGTADILEFLQKHYARGEIKTETFYGTGPGGTVSWSKMYITGVRPRDFPTVYEDNWLVFSEEAGLQLMDEDKFQRQYKEVTDESDGS